MGETTRRPSAARMPIRSRQEELERARADDKYWTSVYLPGSELATDLRPVSELVEGMRRAYEIEPWDLVPTIGELPENVEEDLGLCRNPDDEEAGVLFVDRLHKAWDQVAGPEDEQARYERLISTAEEEPEFETVVRRPGSGEETHLPAVSRLASDLYDEFASADEVGTDVWNRVGVVRDPVDGRAADVLAHRLVVAKDAAFRAVVPVQHDSRPVPEHDASSPFAVSVRGADVVIQPALSHDDGPTLYASAEDARALIRQLEVAVRQADVARGFGDAPAAPEEPFAL